MLIKNNAAGKCQNLRKELIDIRPEFSYTLKAYKIIV